MPNYVRACFCVKEPVSDIKLQELLKVFSAYKCLPVDASQSLAEIGDIELAWEFSGKTLQARFLQIWHTANKQSVFSFDVEDSAFFQGRGINYSPGNDDLFVLYKILLAHVIKQIDPAIGVIDYDEDLLCSESDRWPLASWGNYFSAEWLRHWNSEDRQQLQKIPDECIPIDTLGTLTFIHPMAANQAWTERHAALEAIIKRYKSLVFKPGS